MRCSIKDLLTETRWSKDVVEVGGRGRSVEGWVGEVGEWTVGWVRWGSKDGLWTRGRCVEGWVGEVGE